VSISGISSSTPSPSTANSAQSDFRQQFKQLSDALNGGNLEDAQQAYSALSQLQDSGQGPTANSNSPLAKVLNQIGQALQNGDLTGAQQALQSFQQARGGHHHGHHAGPDASATSQTASSTLAATNSSTNSGASVDLTA
jgi:hypothetical protein